MKKPFFVLDFLVLRFGIQIGAFSSEVDSGSQEENATSETGESVFIGKRMR
jgi:hypothetical protein